MEQESWELMTKRIYRQSIIILIVMSGISIFFMEWRFPVSILIGGLVGIGNLRGIVWSIKNLLGIERSHTKMMVLSMFRLIIVFSVLVALAIFGAINAYGLLVGFSIVFIIIVKEGLVNVRKEYVKKEGKDDKD